MERSSNGSHRQTDKSPLTLYRKSLMAIRSPRLHNQAMAAATYICIFRACWQRERWLKEISRRLINHWRSARRSCRDDKCNQTFARDEKRRRFRALKRDGARTVISIGVMAPSWTWVVTRTNLHKAFAPRFLKTYTRTCLHDYLVYSFYSPGNQAIADFVVRW